MTEELCVFKGCDRPIAIKRVALCKGHYNQRSRGQELAPLKPYKRYPAPAPGKKICNACERVLDKEKDFYTKQNGYPMSWCKPCAIKRHAEYNRLRREREKRAVSV